MRSHHHMKGQTQMNAKRPQAGSSAVPSARARTSAAPPPKTPKPRAPRAPTLQPTETPGVYVNKLGVKCDAQGVALTFKQLRAIDVEVTRELGNEEATLDPLTFLKRLMSDPTASMAVRVDAAKAAATYTHRKPSQGVDGGLDANGNPLPLFVFPMERVKHWPEAKVDLLLEALGELGVPTTGAYDEAERSKAAALVAVGMSGSA